MLCESEEHKLKCVQEQLWERYVISIEEKIWRDSQEKKK